MPPGEYQIPQGFFVTMTIESFTRAKEVFDHLVVNGEVRVPFEPTFWSPGFGVLIDQFAIPWEINTAAVGNP